MTEYEHVFFHMVEISQSLIIQVQLNFIRNCLHF